MYLISLSTKQNIKDSEQGVFQKRLVEATNLFCFNSFGYCVCLCMLKR